MTAAQIIEMLGDTGVIATRLGITPAAVSNMKARGIPRSRLLQLHMLAQELGVAAVTVDVLLSASAPRATV